MGHRCVCTTGTVRHEAEINSKSQRETLFRDMSSAPFAKKTYLPPSTHTHTHLRDGVFPDKRPQDTPKHPFTGQSTPSPHAAGKCRRVCQPRWLWNVGDVGNPQRVQSGGRRGQGVENRV